MSQRAPDECGEHLLCSFLQALVLSVWSNSTAPLTGLKESSRALLIFSRGKIIAVTWPVSCRIGSVLCSESRSPKLHIYGKGERAMEFVFSF